MNVAENVPDLEAFRSNSFAELTAQEFLAHFRNGDISALDYVKACADRIDALNGKYSAFEVYDRAAMEARAGRIDEAPDKLSLAIAGVPLGVKDNINTYDFPTGRGTQILEGYTPGNDARVVSNLRLEGGIVAGKTVTAEFGVHHPGATLYPFDKTRSPGTSSSGSAVAVATRMVPVALGTQTGGSVIRPASYCGVMGYKPSFGTLARTGVLKTTDTLDTVGLLARSVDDLQMAFEICRVSGHNYPFVEAGLSDPSRNVKGSRAWRVGIVVGPKSDAENAVLKQRLVDLVDALITAGDEVSECQLPDIFCQAHDVHERIYSKALSYYLKEEFEWRPELFSEVLRGMMRTGADISAQQYHQDTQKQAEMGGVLEDFLVGNVDVLISLSTAGEAPLGLATRDTPDHNLIWTMCGVPVLSLPLLAGENGLPVGVSVITRKYADYMLFDFARHVEEVSRR